MCFNEFWGKYPNKVGKPAALSAWKRKSPQLPDVLAGLDRWMRSNAWLKDGGQFIPHPSTFLNQERWKDAPPTALAPLARGEVRVRDTSDAERREAHQRNEFLRLKKLPENLGKSDEEIAAMVFEQQKEEVM